jgi:hypothetical protein
MNATKQIEKLEARSERQLAMIGKLKGKVADLKAKRASARSAKAAGKAAPSPKRAPAKRRKPARSTQTSATA